MDRYIGGGVTTKAVGYVETEHDAKEVCEKLNDSVKEKNNTNTMACWHYTFDHIKQFNINDIK